MKEKTPPVIGRFNQINRINRLDDWLYQEDDFLSGKIPYDQEQYPWEDEE